MERIYRLCLTWVLACFVSICGTIWANGEEVDVKTEIELHAQSAVLVDGETGRILYGKNENFKLAMASTTKIMTCLVALENSKMDDIVVFSDYAASMPDVQLDAVSGEAFYMEDLLYALMLESHNDVAVAIAEHVGGTEEKFAQMMNDRAYKLGCKDTHFVTANGLDAEEHYTTAVDLAKITLEALKNDSFCKIIQSLNYVFTNVEQTKTYSLNNKNAFLNMMDGAYGVKTGYTNNAGYCFVGAVDVQNTNLIAVVLGSGWPPNKEWKWTDTLNLINYGLANYSCKKIGKEGMDVGELWIENGEETVVKLRADTQCLNVLLRNTDYVTIDIVKELKRNAPLNSDEIVGWVYYRINNQTVKKYPIYPMASVEGKSYRDCVKNISRKWVQF